MHRGRGEMLPYGQIPKYLVTFWNRGNPNLNKPVRFPAGDIQSVERNPPPDDLGVFRFEEAAQDAAGRCLARSVGSDERGNLPLGYLNRYVLDAKGASRIAEREIFS